MKKAKYALTIDTQLMQLGGYPPGSAPRYFVVREFAVFLNAMDLAKMMKRNHLKITIETIPIRRPR